MKETGIKDKNGNMICDGHTIRYNNCDPMLVQFGEFTEELYINDGEYEEEIKGIGFYYKCNNRIYSFWFRTEQSKGLLIIK